MAPIDPVDTTFSALARLVIHRYSGPCDLIIDPACGVGDVLIEAAKADRMAVGVEHEKYWADVCRERIAAATDAGASGYAAVIHGDARSIDRLVDRETLGSAKLIVASLQSGTCGSASGGAAETASMLEEASAWFTEVLSSSKALLAASGLLAVIVAPIASSPAGNDVLSATATAALRAGFQPVDKSDTRTTLPVIKLYRTAVLQKGMPAKLNLAGDR